MPGLILELQGAALDPNVRVSDLLRKALVVSKKLAVEDVDQWIQRELNGYSSNESIPSYRRIRGTVKVWNPHHGWQSVNFRNAEFGEMISTQSIGQAIGELDDLRLRAVNDDLQAPFSQKQVNMLMKAMEIPLQPSLHVAYTGIVGILDSVRNNILVWALDLERKGILGEGMTFSKEEKSAATQVSYQITNNIGSMTHSQLQQHSSGTQVINSGLDLAALAQVVSTMREVLPKLALDSAVKGEYLAELGTLESQSKSPKPKASILSESLKSVRTILEGAAGNYLAGDLLQKITKVLESLS